MCCLMRGQSSNYRCCTPLKVDVYSTGGKCLLWIIELSTFGGQLVLFCAWNTLVSTLSIAHLTLNGTISFP